MRRRLILGPLVGLLGALALAGTAWPVLGGTPDGSAHPYVGFVEQSDGAGGFELCSGVLVSPTVMVTAAHCFVEGEPVQASLAEDATHQSAFAVTGTVTNDPDFCLGCGKGLPGADTHDLAVVILDQPQSGPFAQLPAVGVTGSLVNKQVDVVGYGVQGFSGKSATTFGTRHVATTKIKGNGAISVEFVKLLADPGACFGDSGGPDLIHGTNTMVAITSFTGGNLKCNGVSYSLRLDTPASLGFIGQFLPA